MRSNKTAWILSGIVVLALIIFIILFSNKGSKDSASLVVISIPRDINITLDGKKVSNKTSMEPGSHTVTISREGFSSHTENFSFTAQEAKSHDNKYVVTVVLGAETEQARKILQGYQESDYVKLEGASSQYGKKDGDYLREKFPLINSLPYIHSSYRIDYAKTKDSNIEIKINANDPLARQVAISQIRRWGYEPSDYDIHFTNHVNPFDVEELKNLGD